MVFHRHMQCGEEKNNKSDCMYFNVFICIKGDQTFVEQLLTEISREKY